MSNWVRTFAVIWTGQLFSILSSAIVSFSVVIWLSIKTASAQVLAYAMLANLLPFIVLGLFIGVYVDRWDRRKTMIIADSFVAICSLAMALLFYFDSVEHWQIYLLLSLRSVGSAFHAPAMQASVPLLAPESQLMRVSGINQIIQSVSNIVGPALGAFLIVIMKMWAIILLDVAGAIIACISLLFVNIPNPVKDEKTKPNIVFEIKEGIRHLLQKKGIRYMFGGEVIATFFIIPLAAMFPLMTLNHFNGKEFEMGIIEMAWGIGMLLGGFMLSLNKMKTINRAWLMNTNTIVMGVCFALSGVLLSSQYWVFVVLTLLAGLACSVYWSTFMVVLQTNIEPSALGRAFSIFDSFSLMPTLPGLLATGFIAQQIGIPNAFIIAGAFVLAVGILSFFIPSVMEIGKVKPPPQEETTQTTE